MATNIWLSGTVDKLVYNRRTTKFRLVTDSSEFGDQILKNCIYVELPRGTSVNVGDWVRVEGELVSHRFSRTLVDEIRNLLVRHHLQRLMPGIERILGKSGDQARIEHVVPEVLAIRVQRVEA